MNEKGLVSVIIPAYNAENTIDKCIDSVINQDYNNIEIIIIDDGSSDETLNICKKALESDNRIRIISQKNSGPAVARNKGIDLANGEYIIFVDSDDWIDKNCISEAVKNAVEKNADIVLWNAVIEYSHKSVLNTPFKGNGRIFDLNDFDYIKKMVLTYTSENNNMSNISFTGPVCKLFKRNIIDNCRFPENLFLGEDLCFMFSILPNVSRISYICHYFYHINRMGESLSKSFNMYYVDWKVDFVNAILLYFENEINYEEDLNIFIFHNYLTVIEHCFFNDSKLNYKEKKRYIEKYEIGISRRINYKTINHKCVFFLKNRWYFPIYFIGKLVRN